MSQAGPDVSRLTPADAVAALRSFPRRFREVLALDDDEDPAVLEPARAEADAAAGVLEAYGGAVAGALVGDASPVEPFPPRGGSVDAVLDRLTLEAGALADRVEHVSAADWARPGALDQLREAVRTVAVHLHEAERKRRGEGFDAGEGG